jgi:death-on-curing protein
MEAHDEALNYGGRPGVVSLDMIESAIARPYSGYHRPIYRKAAALLHSMVGNHGFTDGNKRTAWILTEILIARSDFVLVLDEADTIDDLVVDVAAGETGFDELVLWFRTRIQAVADR